MNVLPSTINLIKQHLENLSAAQFVKLHQNNFKDNYLTFSNDNFKTLNNWLLLPEDNDDFYFMYEEVGIYDTIIEKYRDFFNLKGYESSLKWLVGDYVCKYDKHLQPLWDEFLKYQMSMIDECSEEALELGDNLLYDMVSGYSIASLIYEIIDDIDDDFCSDEKVMEH